jgi:Protein of unknown function (DUF2439)
MQQTQQFSCLYTKQKTQKHKTWLDGRLVASINGTVSLHSADPIAGSGDPILDQTELLRSEIDSIFRNQRQNLELEKYLIAIECPWKEVSSADDQSLHSIVTPRVASGMNKVFARKFQKPSLKVPPPPQSPQQRHHENKRRRPLQPGELVQQYYGSNKESHHSVNPSTKPNHLIPSTNRLLSPSSEYSTVSPYLNAVETSQQYHMDRSPPQHNTIHVQKLQQSSVDREPERMPKISFPLTENHTTTLSSRSHVTRDDQWKQPNIFVSNGFRASSYYGEDFEGDDEENVDGPPDAFEVQSVPMPLSQKEPTPMSNSSFISTLDAAHRTHSNTLNEGKLTNSELLDLFQFDQHPTDMTTNESEVNDEFVLPPADDDSTD